MDGCSTRDVPFKLNLLADLGGEGNGSVRSTESLQNVYSGISPETGSCFSSPLPALRSVGSAYDGSDREGAHDHFEKATHAVSPLSTKRNEPIAALNPQNEGPGGQRLLALLTRSEEEARRAGLICTIETIVRYLVKDLDGNSASVYLTVKARVRSQEDDRMTFHEPAPFMVSSRPSFPGRTTQEAWRFTVVVRILQLVHEALVNNISTTKRDMYYKDPALFRKQTTVDRYVDHLAFTFGVRRASLNVVAAAKGLVAGNLAISRPDGTILHASLEPQGMFVPQIHESDSIDIFDTSWILVIEKEATFQSLASTRFYQNKTIGNGVILTAKGYPDLSTRALLRRLSILRKPYNSHTPVFALVDFDPDGIAIMSTFKHGSIGLDHENEALKVRSVHWLGLKSSDLDNERETDNDCGLLRLTGRDRHIATKMLQRAIFAEELEVEWRRELQVMLMLNIKAEIQLQSGRPGGIEGWLENKISIGVNEMKQSSSKHTS